MMFDRFNNLIQSIKSGVCGDTLDWYDCCFINGLPNMNGKVDELIKALTENQTIKTIRVISFWGGIPDKLAAAFLNTPVENFIIHDLDRTIENFLSNSPLFVKALVTSKGLKKFSMSAIDVKFGTKSLDLIRCILKENTSLRSLELSYCGITDEVFQIIASTWLVEGKAPIVDFDVSMNQLTSLSVANLVKLITQKNLECLDLSRQGLGYTSLISLFSQLKFAPHVLRLRELNLESVDTSLIQGIVAVYENYGYSNPEPLWSGGLAFAIAEFLDRAPSLKVLNLSGNAIGGVIPVDTELTILLSAVARHSTLKKVNLRKSIGITHKTIDKIAELYEKNKTLEKFYFFSSPPAYELIFFQGYKILESFERLFDLLIKKDLRAGTAPELDFLRRYTLLSRIQTTVKEVEDILEDIKEELGAAGVNSFFCNSLLKILEKAKIYDGLINSELKKLQVLKNEKKDSTIERILWLSLKAFNKHKEKLYDPKVSTIIGAMTGPLLFDFNSLNKKEKRLHDSLDFNDALPAANDQKRSKPNGKDEEVPTSSQNVVSRTFSFK